MEKDILHGGTTQKCNLMGFNLGKNCRFCWEYYAKTLNLLFFLISTEYNHDLFAKYSTVYAIWRNVFIAETELIYPVTLIKVNNVLITVDLLTLLSNVFYLHSILKTMINKVDVKNHNTNINICLQAERLPHLNKKERFCFFSQSII